MVRRFGLLGTFGLLVLCLLVVAGVGLYLGWFSISTSGTAGDTPDLHVSLNKVKVKEDMKVVEKDVKRGADAVSGKVHGLLGEKTIAGPIQQVETATQELTIRDDQKQDVTIKVVASTRIKIGDKDSSFSDLAADDPVTVKYEAKKDGNIARTITMPKKS